MRIFKMPKKTRSTKNKQPKSNNTSELHISVGIIITLAISLVVTIAIAACAVQKLKSFENQLSSAKLEVFDHLAESYIHEMESVNSEKPALQQITGYGVSNEDGVFYITFDYTTYEVDDSHNPTYDEPRHAIIYFWKDVERGNYSHAFSYHDDASYHPDGTYVKLTDTIKEP